MGQGMVMDYDGGKHTIKFADGEIVTKTLDYKKAKFKVQSERYVNKFVARAMDDWAKEEMQSMERIEQVTIAKIKRKRKAAKTTLTADVSKEAKKKLGINALSERVNYAKSLVKAAGDTELGKKAGGHVARLLKRAETGVIERTPEEVEEDIEDLFKMLDMDSSDHVSGEELALLGPISGCELTSEQTSQIMAEMDVDGDGSIIFEEFHHWCVELGSELAKQVLQAYAKTKATEEELAFEVASELFEKMDAEQTGSITRDELIQLPTVADVHLEPEEMERFFKELSGRESSAEEDVDMDAFCEWMMGGSRIAKKVAGIDAETKKAQADAKNEDITDDISLHVICGQHTSIKGFVYDSPKFETVRACKGVHKGRWYYEVHIGEARNMQIGYALSGFSVEMGSGDGVGDKGAEGRSWAYDGGRQKKWSQGSISYAPRVKWRAGDTVGCLLDCDEQQLSFTLNGQSLGLAFEEVTASKTQRIFPAVSLKGGPHVIAFTDVLYQPEGYKLFTQAVDDGKAAWEQWLQTPVRDWLALRATQFGRAWVRADKFAKSLMSPEDMVGRPFMFQDTGLHGELSHYDPEEDVYIVLLEGTDGELGTGGQVLVQLKKNHLTQDPSFVQAHIDEYFEEYMRKFIDERDSKAIVAERAAASWTETCREEQRKKDDDPDRVEPEEIVLTKKQKKKMKAEALKEDPVEIAKREKQNAIIDLVDLDGNGDIELQELFILSQIRGYDLTEKDLKEGMKEMDADYSGVVSYDEFVRWLEAGSPIATRVWEQTKLDMLAEQESRVAVTYLTDAPILIGGHITDRSQGCTVRGARTVNGGRWYYEVLLGDKSSARIGFASTDWEPPDTDPPAALGDMGCTGQAWAYDGAERVKAYGGELVYGGRDIWHAGDVVGCLLDLDEGTITFSLNGVSLGVAFRAVKPERGESIFPACTLHGGPHWLRFGSREMDFKPENVRVFGTGRQEDAHSDKRESAARKRAYRKARREGEGMKAAWVSPMTLPSSAALEGVRVDVKGKGKGLVTEVDARGKHTIDFDNGAKLKTKLGDSGYSVLSASFIAGHVNAVMAGREERLFKQRMNLKLERAAKNALKGNGKQKKSKKNKGGGDDDDDDDDDDADEDGAEAQDDDLMEIEGEFDGDDFEADGRTDDEDIRRTGSGDERAERKKRKQERKEQAKLKKKDKKGKKGRRGKKGGSSEEEDDDELDEEDGAEEDIENNELAPYFVALLASRQTKEQHLIEGQRLSLEQDAAWLNPPNTEGDDAISPQDFVGRTIKYQKKGVGEVLEYLDGKKPKHLVHFSKGNSKVALDEQAILKGAFKVLDKEFVDTFVAQYEEQATVEWCIQECRRIEKEQRDKDRKAVRAAQIEEFTLKTEMAVAAVLAPGLAVSSGVKAAIPMAKSASKGIFMGLRGAFQATMALTEGVTKATNLVMAATDKGVQQMEKHMGMLTRKQINALCERLDDDEDGALSRFEIVKIGSVLQVALTDEDMQHMLRELRLDTGEVEAVDFEVVGQWLNSSDPVASVLRPLAKQELKELVDWVGNARAATEVSGPFLVSTAYIAAGGGAWFAADTLDGP
jgi:Ca2+-binding EF-hand superfamily protein